MHALLGKELEEKLKAITVLREDGAVVNTKITIASAKGVILSHDANLLAANGGHIELTKHRTKSFLRMGFVKRKGTTKSKVGVANFDAVKQQFLSDVKSIVVWMKLHNLSSSTGIRQECIMYQCLTGPWRNVEVKELKSQGSMIRDN